MKHSHIRIAYVGGRYLKEVTAEDLEILTHINIAFGLVKNSKVAYEHIMQYKTDIERIRALNPDIKILLSVGGWGAGGFSDAAMTVKGCVDFAASALEAKEALELDGIDIDWEYPCNNDAGIDASPEDIYNFTTMIKALRDALGDALVTIAAGAGKYFIEGTQMDVVSRYLDYVQIMTYDMRGGFSHITGHHTNLYEPEGDDRVISVETAVEDFHGAGVPYDKIVIGAAFYSRRWNDVESDINHGLHQKSPDVGGYGYGFTELKEKCIGDDNAGINGFTRYFDDNANAPFLFDGKTFISYDDEVSIKHKCRYLAEKGLLGIMYWEHSCDPKRYLLNAIAEGFKEV